LKRGTPTLYTIGHSNHPIEAFLDLLRLHGVDVLVDVRTVPHSRRHPQVRKRDLARSCAAAGIAYRWRGDDLGGIKRDSACRSFAEAAARPGFAAALDELVELARGAAPALMCAEKEPMDCHRTVLVCRHLAVRPDGSDLAIRHIHADGSLETHEAFESRLIAAMRTAGDLFQADPLAAAYDTRAARMLGQR
jgi:uncharacterized protein (DUF488 family)